MDFAVSHVLKSLYFGNRIGSAVHTYCNFIFFYFASNQEKAVVVPSNCI